MRASDRPMRESRCGRRQTWTPTKGGGSSMLPPRFSAPWKISELREQLLDIFPIDQVVDERLQIVRAAVAIVDVIGMLPDVTAEDRRAAMDQRAFAVGCLGDFQLAVLHRQPAPARTELADAGGGEIGLELLEAAEVLVDLLLQTAGQFAAAAIGLHPVPEMHVVVVLSGIVEDGGKIGRAH